MRVLIVHTTSSLANGAGVLRALVDDQCAVDSGIPVHGCFLTSFAHSQCCKALLMVML